MIRSGLSAMLVASSALLAAGPHWTPIPSEVWAMKATSQDRGAVFLSRRLEATAFKVEWTQRVRILAERGKAAAECPWLPSEAMMAGRVVYPDGRVLTFDSQKDFISRTALSSSDWAVKGKVMLPPGLTEDCVVDLWFREDAPWIRALQGGSPAYRAWELASPYPTREMVVEVEDGRFQWAVRPGSAPMTSGFTASGLGKVFTFRDLPALEEVPFTLRTARDIPRFIGFATYGSLIREVNAGPGPFWKGAAAICQQMVTGGLAGKATRDLSRELRQDLPATPQAAATELALRLGRRLRNLSQATWEERDLLHKGGRLDPEDLDAGVRRGASTGWGLWLTYRELLKDAGIPHRIAAVFDRDEVLLGPRDTHLTGLDTFLVLVDEPGLPTLHLDPANRWHPPGCAPPSFQGTNALELDPSAGATWSHRWISIPTTPSSLNTRTETYRLDLQEEQDRFALDATFTGWMDYLQRRDDFGIEPGERDRRLREALERGHRDRFLDLVRKRHVDEPGTPVAWRVEGRLERAPGRRRVVDPFPLTTPTLQVPADLPEARRDMVALPCARVHTVRSVFKVPQGWRATLPESILQANAWGEVALEATQAGDEVTVELTVTVHAALGPATSWPGLRTFLSWLPGAYGARVVLERP